MSDPFETCLRDEEIKVPELNVGRLPSITPDGRMITSWTKYPEIGIVMRPSTTLLSDTREAIMGRGITKDILSLRQGRDLDKLKNTCSNEVIMKSPEGQECKTKSIAARNKESLSENPKALGRPQVKEGEQTWSIFRKRLGREPPLLKLPNHTSVNGSSLEGVSTNIEDSYFPQDHVQSCVCIYCMDPRDLGRLDLVSNGRNKMEDFGSHLTPTSNGSMDTMENPMSLSMNLQENVTSGFCSEFLTSTPLGCRSRGVSWLGTPPEYSSQPIRCLSPGTPTSISDHSDDESIESLICQENLLKPDGKRRKIH